MNVDRILNTFNQHSVQYLLIGGMNFMLRHEPMLTFDVDLWIEDSDENRMRCEAALAALGAEWGLSDADWAPVGNKPSGWLTQQGMFCLNTPHGAIDVFRSVAGLPDWHQSFSRAIPATTSGGTSYFGICDEDMLACQLALDPSQQKLSRVQYLEAKLKGQP